MRKNIHLSFLLLILFSCSKNKKDLKLELLTSQVFCVKNIEKKQFLENFYLPNGEYDSLSKNILNYKITNISDKKYYIMLNENSIGTLERDFYNEALVREKSTILNNIAFSMYKNDSILDGNSTKVEDMCGNNYNIITRKLEIVDSFLVKNKINEKYKLKYIDEIDESLQGFFLKSGETKYFTSIINLPYRNKQKWFSNIDNKKPNLGSLSLQNDSIFTKKIITENRKKEIKENGYILFDGIIYSNKIPVKLITIKK